MRHNFSIDTWYAAKLARVSRRPVENDVDEDFICLLRLEFEIFMIFESSKRLHSRGELACRDLLIGKALERETDAGLEMYVKSLAVNKWQLPASWEQLVKREKWIKIQFNEPDSETHRNSVARIQPFNNKGYLVKKAPFDLTRQWVLPAEAAHYLGVSPSTIRRRTKLAQEMGYDHLEDRTQGGHRRLDMTLLWNIWDQLKPQRVESKKKPR